MIPIAIVFAWLMIFPCKISYDTRAPDVTGKQIETVHNRDGGEAEREMKSISAKDLIGRMK